MSEPSKQELIQLVQRIRAECDRLEERINSIAPEKEWLNTAEFAERSGLTLKTVSTYCGTGRFAHCRKTAKGRWQIHKSELDT